jgi:hypothetical protein
MVVIPCTAEAIEPNEALIASRSPVGFCLRAPVPATYPIGLTLDVDIGTIIFDMDSDFRVMNIEFMVRVGGTVASDREAKRMAPDGFHRLALTGCSGDLSAKECEARVIHKGADWIGWSFGRSQSPARYWIGGGGFADVERGALVGLGLRFKPAIRLSSKPFE